MFLPSTANVKFCADKSNSVMTAIDDGMVRYGKSFLREFGQWDGISRYCCACLIRGVIYSIDSNQTAIVKGMCKYDSSLEDDAIGFPKSTRKVSSPGRAAGVELYIDIVCYTDRVMSEPMLNGSVAANLKLGIAMMPADQRKEAEDLWTAMVDDARDCTLEKLVRKAWALPCADELPDHVDGRCRLVDNDEWIGCTTPAEQIDLLPLAKAGPGVPQTPTSLMVILQKKI